MMLKHLLLGNGSVNGVKAMTSVDDFRIKSHALLADLDAATTEMMELISSHSVSGPAWEEAVKRQHDAYVHWNAFINSRDGRDPPDSQIAFT
jgi:hypothetical protein